ncbi:ATPase [Croceibacterium sp. LX-88]|uniref:ATPase n=1 Tax=Croceibacterium selenioxidans TaxID=2838833 RepID=A0ABS5W274_9SPHN|nr:ATPase [Croceibacterium selenioxidans]MBT2133855.1 ATPase [Croceibacterium selenioxidans]
MASRKNLVAFGPETQLENAAEAAQIAQPAEDPPADDIAEAFDEQWVEDEQPRHFDRLGRLLPAVAGLAVVGWTAFFGWVHREALLTGASPAQWADWIVDWSVPVLLVIGVWLLAMRNSRREAVRFGQAAQALSQESALLERRLVTVNRELSLARDFIAAQSRDLESLGRVASDRLSQNADRLQTLIQDNGAQVEAIGRVSTTALENMDRLRDDLPVISNSARDVASQIGHAGGVAKEQLDELVAGFNRLNEFGEASSRQVSNLRGKVDEALQAFTAQAAQLDEIATNRFAILAERSAAFRGELDSREVEAFAAIRRRADTLRDELQARRDDYDLAEDATLTALRERMNLLRDEGARVAESLRNGEAEAASAWSNAVSELEQRMIEAIQRVREVDTKAMENAQSRLAALSEEAERIDATIVDRVQAFQQHLEQRHAEASAREAAALASMQERLAAFDMQISERQEEHLAHVAGLAERGDALAERLAGLSAEMERLERQGRFTQDGLSEAAAGLVERLVESQSLIASSGKELIRLTDDSVRLLELIRSSAEHSGEKLPQSLGEAERRLQAFEKQATALTTLINEAGDKGAALVDHVATAQEQGSATLVQLSTLESRLSDLAGATESLADHAREELVAAIAALEQATGGVIANLQGQHSEAIRALAERIGSESSAAIDEALRAHASEAIEELQAAARQASESGRATTVQLRDQLAAVNELAGNLERRVAHARQRAEEQIDNDFARRMALITESLNSSAIDITKSLDTDVTDTAWASYLRGDRGIFTRRAVRLLNTQEVRAIADIYQEDGDFRETVNRYIHDFEAMLRNVLSTRDGHAMAVTLLSSDMGKLYVALAQAIERLRT